jgi:hypothetical protein
MENSLTKDDIIIRVRTGKSACSVIIGETVGPRAVILEVNSGGVASACIWVVVLATTAELICVVSDA